MSASAIVAKKVAEDELEKRRLAEQERIEQERLDEEKRKLAEEAAKPSDFRASLFGKRNKDNLGRQGLLGQRSRSTLLGM